MLLLFVYYLWPGFQLKSLLNHTCKYEHYNWYRLSVTISYPQSKGLYLDPMHLYDFFNPCLTMTMVSYILLMLDISTHCICTLVFQDLYSIMLQITWQSLQSLAYAHTTLDPLQHYGYYCD